MAYKAVLFQRVSTNKQDTYRQNFALIEQIHKDGYSDDEVYIIDYKESGVKLSYQQRQGFMELEEVIENNPIEIVYCHEISRVARREDVTFTLVQKLTEKGINLHIQTPQMIRTLNEDGTENAIAKLVITFLAYFANEEAKQFKIRSKSGREAALAKGQVYTSSVKYGYKVVNKKIQIDEDDAAIVKRMFDDYINTDMGVVDIFTKYHDMDVLKKCKVRTKQSGACYVGKLLKDYTYCGEHSVYNYPAILSKETIDKAIAKMDASPHKVRATKNIYYCRGLIKVGEHTLSPNVSQCSYKYDSLHNLDNNEHLDFYSLNMNILDTLAMTEAILLYSVYTANKSLKDKEWAISRVKELEDEIEGFKRQTKKVDGELERTLNLYKRGIIDIDEVDTAKRMHDKQIEILNGKIDKDTNEKTNLTALLAKEQGFAQSVDDVFANRSDESIYEIVHQMIDKIDVKKIANGDYEIRIIPKVKLDYQEGDTKIRIDERTGGYYHYVGKAPHIKLYTVHNGVEMPYDGEILKRFKRKR